MNIENGRQFVDMMDRTRMVMVVGSGSDKNHYRCRVYFKDTGYVGNVDVAKALFTEVPFEKDGRTPTLLGRIGFVPVGIKPREAE